MLLPKLESTAEDICLPYDVNNPSVVLSQPVQRCGKPPAPHPVVSSAKLTKETRRLGKLSLEQTYASLDCNKELAGQSEYEVQ